MAQGRRRIHVSTRVDFFNCLDRGMSVADSARAVGISVETGYKWRKAGLNLGGRESDTHTSGSQNRQRRLDLSQSEPVSRQYLSVEAQRALDDFDYFRRRYLGRRATPWQRDAADRVVGWLLSPETEYAVINCPPGSGKSTLFTNDLLLWLICRDRSIRILIGSSTQNLAANYSNRLRRALERTRPLPANPGIGREAAEAALTQDFGRFKPLQAEGQVWTRGQFTVAQGDGEGAEDKEPTVASYGKDAGFLGHRANLVIWDDLVTKDVVRSAEQTELQRQWWTEEGETRLEPGGLLLLQGQRMAAEDLYRYCLDMLVGDDEDDEDSSGEAKYNHVIYPAHDEDRCESNHGKDAPAWPEGCLLDPVRLPWKGKKGLATIRRNNPGVFSVQYQQEDTDPDDVLVQKIWIDGGRDAETGEQHPGCWDNERGLAQPPSGLSAPWVSVATADPSPTKYWSIQWWIVHPETNQRFLLDLIRQSMDAPDFLDWNQNERVFFGIMQEWQERSAEYGYPISHWIVENNAAQRFILQYDHFRRWQRVHGVQVIAHSTHKNKADPKFGIETLKNLYRFGQVRLPGKGHGRIASLKLIDEVTRYNETYKGTDDCLMAQWFLEYQLANGALHRHTDREPVVLRRPSWIRRKVAA